MTTEHYLWAILGLLFLAFVLVVITARRGPWAKPKRSAGVLWVPADAMPIHDDDGLAADLLMALRTGNPSGAPLPEVRIIAPNVDPLWGKNRPEGS